MGQKVILVIDDQQDLRFILAFDLKKEGYKILEASNGEAGIESARQNKPDLILCDRKMPVMDGVETCKQLKSDEETKNIPILMLTGMAEKDEVEQAISAGASGYVIKPFKLDRLLNKITEVIG